jgi:glycosyltransferase involved in cell wall biosynthesis
MKIVQILPELNEGGVERGTMELSREFVALGHESIVISCGGKLVSNIEADGGKHISLDVCSKNPLTALARIYKLRKVLKSLKPDIVHVRSRVPAWLTYFANKSLKIPFVTTVHGLNSISSYSRIMTKGDRVICVGEAVQEYIINGYALDNNDNRITTIQRGVDLSRFNILNIDKSFIKSFKEEHELENKYIVTSVGRITWLKDYETFIEAIAIAKLEIPNIIGLIVGGAGKGKIDYLNSLKRLVAQYNLEDNIKFTGSQSKMPEIYFLSNILVNASLKMGNVARTIIEALALDTLVIATTYEGLNDIVVDGKNGAIIETKNAKQLANKIVEVKNNNYQNVSKTIPKEYTLDMMSESTLDVYKNLLNHKRDIK